MKRTTAELILLIAFTALTAAQNAERGSKPRPSPEMQRVTKMLLGTWKVDEDFAPGNSVMPQGGKGMARSVITLGPGGLSLIEDFVGTSSPAVHLYGVYWWDPAAHGLRSFGCNDLEEGCSVLDGLGRWQGNDVVTELKFQEAGKTKSAKLVWTQKDRDSFTATMYIADSNGVMKRDWAFLHTRVK